MLGVGLGRLTYCVLTESKSCEARDFFDAEHFKKLWLGQGREELVAKTLAASGRVDRPDF